MKRVIMKTIKSERGQSLVELAVSLVLLLLLLSGAVEFGIAYFQFVQLRDAAQEGALFGSLNPTADITGRARGASCSPIQLNLNCDATTPNAAVTITVTATDKSTSTSKSLASACEGDGLTVTMTFQHKVFMPFLS